MDHLCEEIVPENTKSFEGNARIMYPINKVFSARPNQRLCPWTTRGAPLQPPSPIQVRARGYLSLRSIKQVYNIITQIDRPNECIWSIESHFKIYVNGQAFQNCIESKPMGNFDTFSVVLSCRIHSALGRCSRGCCIPCKLQLLL